MSKFFVDDYDYKKAMKRLSNEKLYCIIGAVCAAILNILIFISDKTTPLEYWTAGLCVGIVIALLVCFMCEYRVMIIYRAVYLKECENNGNEIHTTRD